VKKKIFFLHSAGPQGPHEGSSDLVAWLKSELGSGYQLIHPAMPRPEAPDYALWKAKLKEELAKVTGEVVFIGHSLGGSILLKYLAQEPLRNPIAGMFLVSVPFWSGDEDWVQPFILPEDFATRLPAIPKLFLYHSKNDPHVPVSHQVLYAQALPRAAVRVLDGEDHEFSHGIPQLVADLKRLKG
jgi:hypothetical protein